MASQKVWKKGMTSLDNLYRSVKRFHDLCLPDFVYREKTEDHMKFCQIESSSFGEPDLPDEAGVLLKNPANKDKEATKHIFTEWSRHQLLSRLGTTEKWFRGVSLPVEVEELNTRLPCLYDMMVRSHKSAVPDEAPVRVIRGLVSHLYTDIPDLSIMSAFKTLFPEDKAVIGKLSGKTDRAFYGYFVDERKIYIPKTYFQGYPGVVVKNSEVGSCSLSVTPFLWNETYGTAAVLMRSPLLRKVHKGKVNNLSDMLQEALKEVGSLWDTLQMKVQKLITMTYPTQDEALDKMESMLLSAGSTKRFVNTCRSTYEHRGVTTHTAMDIFDVIMECIKDIDEDESFSKGSIAGGVLFRLIF